MRRTTTGGYDGPLPDDNLTEVIEYDVTQVEQMYSSRFVVTIRRNGNASGLLYLEDEAEFEWLRNRIRGFYRRDEATAEQMNPEPEETDDA